MIKILFASIFALSLAACGAGFGCGPAGCGAGANVGPVGAGVSVGPHPVPNYIPYAQ